LARRLLRPPRTPGLEAKRTPAPEHASDEGLFTGSLQAVERASLFMRGQKRLFTIEGVGGVVVSRRGSNGVGVE